jgi:hypothetical protein
LQPKKYRLENYSSISDVLIKRGNHDIECSEL